MTLPDSGLNALCKKRKHFRIDGVCFGKLPCIASKIANLAGIDDNDGQAGRAEIGGETFFKTAGSFKNNALRRVLFENTKQSRTAICIGRKALGKTQRSKMEIESQGGDINPGERGFRHGATLPCNAGSQSGPSEVGNMSGQAARLRSRL